MEYANDSNGKRIHYSKGKKGFSYKCPYCLEPVLVRDGLNACFYHRPIRDRTPQQRTCPEYHEDKSYKRIDNKLDIIYINNGGIPLYLCSNEGRFQLKAYFPQISEESFKQLKQAGTKIYVNTKAQSEIDRKVYTVDELYFYPVNTIEKWIYIECKPAVSLTDVRQKWLWGIRGVDIENDIYHSNKDGGYRVALKADISVGKTYRIMFYNNPPKVRGISFEQVGEIFLKKGYTTQIIAVYEMSIDSFTEEARRFIEGKGYRLVEKSSELLPLWPPAVFKGNEITFNKRKALFLYINNSKKENLYFILYNKMFEIDHTEGKNCIIPLTVDANKSIVITDEENERFSSEIKYNISYNPSLIKKQQLKQQIVIKDSNDIEVDFSDANIKPPKDGKLYISSNIPFCATVLNKDYVIYSSNACFENVDYIFNLLINSGAFGIKKYTYKRKNYKIEGSGNIDWKGEFLKLYRCNGPTINADNHYFQLLYLLSQNINRSNVQLYRLLETWIKTNAIPISAVKYMDDIFKSLGGVSNE
ncbi:hypothetical protein [Xylanivirga thermophila]|uniref:hypothetical protein n=1 Tax=Xylanivirga thermophila TaxID=2496273 RepID=UPI00101C61D2|nr:hypothetical protein [Xylanivirga thermophila]